MEVWKMWFPLDCALTKPATESGTFKVKQLHFFPQGKDKQATTSLRFPFSLTSIVGDKTITYVHNRKRTQDIHKKHKQNWTFNIFF